MSYHVQRNGEAIGDYDERTMLALLHAGGLRLTDTYQASHMATAEPLSDLISGKSEWPTRLLPLLVVITGLGFVATVAWVATRLPTPSHMIKASGQRAEPAEEIHRGYPVLHGTLTASARAAPATFPFERVEHRAVHGRVAILALDEQEAPRNFGSGFLTQDGLHVVTALSVVRGAGSVEVWFENGRRVPAANFIINPEKDVVVLGIADPGVGLDWSSKDPAVGEELVVTGNGLLPAPSLSHVQESEDDNGHMHYTLDTPLPPSFAGSAVLNAMGDTCGVVIQPETGLVLCAADIRALLADHKPVPMETLAHLPSKPAGTPVVVDSAVIEDGELVMQLRNTSGATVNRALLYIRFHDLPPQSDETASLERQLAVTAVEVCTLEIEAPTSERYFQIKQELRQITTKLEALRHLASAAIVPARQRLHRTDVVAVEATLPPGLPQRLAIATEAGSAWGATVSVLDALE
ncbi:MAG: Trypsin-like serine protease [Verrucomicrobiaceae bacterium]|nr:Trypsin-like serine protease [Verrucomicrobiaceae bacterium]